MPAKWVEHAFCRPGCALIIADFEHQAAFRGDMAVGLAPHANQPPSARAGNIRECQIPAFFASNDGMPVGKIG